MRKASQDGGDSTSITSGFENETKKPGTGILKTKRNSLKKKVQNFSFESDDAVIEPLLQKGNEKVDVGNQSAKFLLSKTKTDSTSDKGNDMDKLLADNKVNKPSITNIPSSSGNSSLADLKDSTIHKPFTSNTAPMHNHMNTNVFGGQDGTKGIVAPKSQILIEIETSKSSGYSPSPLIFTTAKIHTDGKTKQMEPVQVTPVPILSTIEGNIVKAEPVTDFCKNMNGSKNNNNSNIVCAQSGPSDIKSLIKDHFTTASNSIVSNTPYSGSLCKNADSGNIYGEIKVLSGLSKQSTLSSVSSAPSQPIITTDTKMSNVNIIDSKEVVTGLSLPKTDSNLVSDGPSQTLIGIMKSVISDKSNKSEPTPSGKTHAATDTSKTDKNSGKITTNAIVKLDGASAPNEIKVDINKNIEPSTTAQKAGPSADTKKSNNDNKFVCDIIDKDNKISKTATNSSTKQLPRQKNAIIEDPSTSKITKSVVNSDHSNIGNPAKVSKDLNDKSITSSKNKIGPELEVSKNAKSTVAQQKSGVNKVTTTNTIHSTTKFTVTESTVKPITSKVSVESTTSAIKPLVCNVTSPTTIPKSTTTVSKPSGTSGSVSTVKPSTIIVTSASIYKPISSLKLVTSGSMSNVTNSIKTQSTPSTKTVHSSVPSTTGTKTPTTLTTKYAPVSSTSIKPSVGTTIKSTTTNATTNSIIGKTVGTISSSTTSTGAKASKKFTPPSVSNAKNLPSISTGKTTGSVSSSTACTSINTPKAPISAAASSTSVQSSFIKSTTPSIVSHAATAKAPTTASISMSSAKMSTGTTNKPLMAKGTQSAVKNPSNSKTVTTATNSSTTAKSSVGNKHSEAKSSDDNNKGIKGMKA